jgi:futalosine hydrolase
MTDLILIPTELEHRFLSRGAHGFDRRGDCDDLANRAVDVELCGFGLVAAATRAMQLIAQRRPSRVILVGIAGALDPSVPVGTAIEFGSVAVDGIGVGFGDRFQTAAAMGWPHWHDPSSSVTIGDRIELQTLGGPELLSVCAASADADHASLRRQHYCHAVAEDMEGFGVAMACQLMQVPLRIVRGISNVAGNRDFKTWQVEFALQQAGRLVDAILMNEEGQSV